MIDLDKDKNQVIVGEEDDTFKQGLKAVELNWVSIPSLDKEMKVSAKVRSAQTPVEITLKPQGEDEVLVEFENMQKSLTRGQSVVFYDGDILLGGGIIDDVF